MTSEVDAVGAEEERWEDDVAQAAGDPYGDKEGDEHSDDKGQAHLLGAGHQYIAGGGPGADEDVAGVRNFGAGQDIGDDYAEQGGGGDQVPFLYKAQMEVGFVGMVAVGAVVVVGGIEGVQGGVRREGCAEDGLAQIGQDAVAEGGDADGADVADDQNQQEAGGLSVHFEECGGDHGTEDDVEGVKDGEQAQGVFLADILEEEHEEDTQECPNERKRAMCPKFGSDKLYPFRQCHCRSSMFCVSSCNSVATGG